MTTTITGARKAVIAAARRLADDVDRLSFGDPVCYVYNPLRYAWKAHQAYLARVHESGARARTYALCELPNDHKPP